MTQTRAQNRNRRYVLAGVVVALGLVTGFILLDVLGTILFAITVAYVLTPVHGWLVRRGLSEWTAGVCATLVGFISVLAILSPIILTLYYRVDDIVTIIRGLPDEFSITVYETTMTIQAVELQTMAASMLQGYAGSIASSAPFLAVKFALFVLLLFGLLLKGEEAAKAAVAPVPREYRDIAFALAGRAREVLYAIYVLQVATGVATFVVGFPFFWMLGYDAAFMLAILAAILQFVPMIGPSLLLVPIALYHLAVGELILAALVGALGIPLIAWLPDVTVRPRLARRSAGLSGSLYFIGFTGGLFTLGMIGIIVGPLIVAVFVEAVSLLADEVNGSQSLADLVESTEAESGPESGTDFDANTGSESVPVDAETDTGPGSDTGSDTPSFTRDDSPPS